MRPPRVAILVLFFAASLFLFCRSISSLRRSNHPVIAPASAQKPQLHSYFSWGVPFALFPPNAAISLTDDNSTFFPARPAAFGPALPAKGLSGQLWIGSGFADDNLQDGEGEGELGCSDVPGWEDGKAAMALLQSSDKTSKSGAKTASGSSKAKNSKRDAAADGPLVDRTAEKELQPPARKAQVVDDGTDDYLHQSLQQSGKSSHDSSSSSGSGHADIQSIQEAAEITGKIVLLSRGGCGFLEKVKWAQRRGAIALIVGDNVRGGPLIQMFAHGDVDNVTIPSIFTSRTTAHLLSSLMQPGSFIEDIIDENGNAALKVQHYDKSRKGKKGKQTTTTTTTTTPRATTPPKSKTQTTKKDLGSSGGDGGQAKSRRGGFFSRLFRWGSTSDAASDRSRPPSSGRLDWVLVDDWSDEKDKIIKTSLDKASSRSSPDTSKSESQQASEDDFQIGVQDWRDPDLVGSPSDSTTKSSARGKDDGMLEMSSSGGKSQSSAPGASTKQSGKKDAPDSNGPKGGSITPSSGEYVPGTVKDNKQGSSSSGKPDGASSSEGGFISKIFGDDDGTDFVANDGLSKPASLPPQLPEGDDDGPGEHREGLWVTITPTSSASPFFDTLLILVISPLITLTVVYALLIIRAKIRRRRWRAPKSVVDQLPVRTYHTVASSPSHTPRLPSPTSSSPTTPLLQRPRSRTTTGVVEGGDLLRVDSGLSSHDTNTGHGQVSSQWKKYMGRQVECVVCLEEYVDGVSRVMSLPCGHEFHAECITPWLTTRRRTCPICKGDVVRSLARGSPSSPRYEAYHDDSDDEEDVGEATASDPRPRSRSRSGLVRSLSATREINNGGDRERDRDRGRDSDEDSDVERGLRVPVRGRPARAARTESWFTILSTGLGERTPPPRRRSNSEEDRRR